GQHEEQRLPGKGGQGIIPRRYVDDLVRGIWCSKAQRASPDNQDYARDKMELISSALQLKRLFVGPIWSEALRAVAWAGCFRAFGRSSCFHRVLVFSRGPHLAEYVVEFGRDGGRVEPDGRLDAPAFHRNHEPLWAALEKHLAGCTGDVVELGSGTGQHVVHF